jgi:hypothetical protein
MAIANVKTYADLREEVRSKGDILNVPMWKLRDIHGAGKLGVHVVKSISDRLSANGLGHQPPELPADQNETVRIYALGSPVGAILDAARHLTTESNRLLRDLANNDAANTIKKIKELVCD